MTHDHRTPRPLLGIWWRGGSPAGYGRTLLVGALGAALLAMAVLHHGAVDAALLTLAVVGTAAALGLSFLLPRREAPAWRFAAYPLGSMAVVVVCATAVPGISGVFSGFFALCFAYAGLFLPRHGALALVVPGLAAYTATTTGPVNPQLLVREVLLAIAWVVLGELLGRMQRRHAGLVARLQADGTTDPLTGLANRRGMERFLATAEPGDVVVVFDLDHFKRLNDSHGHAAGDEVLRTFGGLLLRELRTRDGAARSGGEEMVAFLRCGEPRCGQDVVRRLRASLAAACPGVSFSAGIAVVGAAGSAAALEAADRAMYRAKAAGRDQAWLAGDDLDGSADVPSAALTAA